MKLLKLLFVICVISVFASARLGEALERTEVVIARLKKQLKDPDHEVRIKGIKGLGDIGPEARIALNELTEILEKDKVAEVRIEAASCVGAIFFRCKIEPHEKKVVFVLAKTMRKDDDLLVRRSACYALRMMERDRGARDAVPDFFELMRDKKEDPVLREWAADAFVRLVGPESKKLVPTLVEMFGRNRPSA
jgi:HEAT repeat protein